MTLIDGEKAVARALGTAVDAGGGLLGARKRGVGAAGHGMWRLGMRRSGDGRFQNSAGGWAWRCYN